MELANATCELDGCSVVAIGRCLDCGKTFCLTHMSGDNRGRCIAHDWDRQRVHAAKAEADHKAPTTIQGLLAALADAGNPDANELYDDVDEWNRMSWLDRRRLKKAANNDWAYNVYNGSKPHKGESAAEAKHAIDKKRARRHGAPKARGWIVGSYEFVTDDRDARRVTMPVIVLTDGTLVTSLDANAARPALRQLAASQQTTLAPKALIGLQSVASRHPTSDPR